MSRHLSPRRARRRTVGNWTSLARLLPLASVIVLAACSSGSASGTVDRTDETTISGVSTEELEALPVREGPRRETTGDVPHIQIGATPVPELDAELERRAFELPASLVAH